MSISADDLSDLGDATVIGADGDKIGTVGQFYVSDATGQPTWATIKTGLFGTQETFVPLRGASVRPGELRVAFDKATVKDAPRVDADGHLTPQDEDDLYRFYNVDDDDGETRMYAQSNHPAPGDSRGDVVDTTDGRQVNDTSMATADDASHRPTERGGGDSAPTGTTENYDLSDRDDRAPYDNSPSAADGGEVTPGETRTRMRRYIVTEHITQTVEELPDRDRA